jgi:transposase-like protein
MFEDETVDVACPACGHRNALAVREFEDNPEQHFVCPGCKQHIRIDGTEFKGRLDAIRAEVLELERSSGHKPEKPAKRQKKPKDSWQI